MDRINIDGIEIAADYRKGNSNIATVVFSHGGASNNSAGKPLADFFHSKGHAVLTYDLPGHGHSGPYIHDRISVETLARILHKIIQKYGIKNPILAGHSLGGMISMQYALAYPGNAAALILICTYYASPTKVNVKINQEQIISLIEKAHEKYESRFYDLLQHTSSEDAIIEAGLKSTHPDSLEKLLDAVLNFDIRIQIQKLQVPPTLIMTGREDSIMTPDMAFEMQQNMKGSICEIVEGGHNWFIQNPKLMQEVLKRYYHHLVRIS